MTLSKLLVVTLSAVLLWTATASALAVGDKAPSFQGVTLSGKPVSLADAKEAKAMVLIFWTTWCPYCQVAIPIFKEAYAKYAPMGVLFFALNPGRNDSLKKVELYTAKHELPYPVVYDEHAEIARLFGIQGVPTVFIVDPEGVIRYIGNEVGPELGSIIDSIMKKPEQASVTGQTVPALARF
jgi:peroxiredoxin